MNSVPLLGSGETQSPRVPLSAIVTYWAGSPLALVGSSRPTVPSLLLTMISPLNVPPLITPVPSGAWPEGRSKIFDEGPVAML